MDKVHYLVLIPDRNFGSAKTRIDLLDFAVEFDGD